MSLKRLKKLKKFPLKKKQKYLTMLAELNQLKLDRKMVLKQYILDLH